MISPVIMIHDDFNFFFLLVLCSSSFRSVTLAFFKQSEKAWGKKNRYHALPTASVLLSPKQRRICLKTPTSEEEKISYFLKLIIAYSSEGIRYCSSPLSLL